MEGLYARWMLDWENKLCSRATNRVVRPFDWGLDWTHKWPTAQRVSGDGYSEAEYLHALNLAVLASSDEFFAYETPRDFSLDPADRMLRFTSPVETPYPENNRVHAQFFLPEGRLAPERRGTRKVAAIILPHWNASAGQHGALGVGLAKLGIVGLRLSLPYHDYRM